MSNNILDDSSPEEIGGILCIIQEIHNKIKGKQVNNDFGKYFSTEQKNKLSGVDYNNVPEYLISDYNLLNEELEFLIKNLKSILKKTIPNIEKLINRFEKLGFYQICDENYFLKNKFFQQLEKKYFESIVLLYLSNLIEDKIDLKKLSFENFAEGIGIVRNEFLGLIKYDDDQLLHLRKIFCYIFGLGENKNVIYYNNIGSRLNYQKNVENTISSIRESSINTYNRFLNKNVDLKDFVYIGKLFHLEEFEEYFYPYIFDKQSIKELRYPENKIHNSHKHIILVENPQSTYIYFNGRYSETEDKKTKMEGIGKQNLDNLISKAHKIVMETNPAILSDIIQGLQVRKYGKGENSSNLYRHAVIIPADKFGHQISGKEKGNGYIGYQKIQGKDIPCTYVKMVYHIENGDLVSFYPVTQEYVDNFLQKINNDSIEKTDNLI